MNFHPRFRPLQFKGESRKGPSTSFPVCQRSASTLLSAILRQSPRLHAGMTVSVESLVEAILLNMSVSSETAVFITDQQREAPWVLDSIEHLVHKNKFQPSGIFNFDPVAPSICPSKTSAAPET